MSKNTTSLQIFIGYITDVEGEVEQCKEKIKELNNEIHSTDYWIDVTTFKDHQAGDYGNPQQRINVWVKKSDIFIGVVGQKWGSNTGQTDCGFREEFDIAKTRFEAKESINLLLYAKKINESALSRAEKTKYKPLKLFKEKIKKDRAGWLAYFKNKNDLSSQVKRKINTLLHSRISESNSEKRTAEKNPTTHPEKKQKKISTAKNNLPTELKTIFNRLNKEATSGLDNSRRVRLFLFSQAILYIQKIFETLGNHESNLIYLHGKKFKLTFLEFKLILRTIISDQYDHKPGWQLIRKIFSKKLKNIKIGDLVPIFLDDQNLEVRTGTLDLIERFKDKTCRKYVLRSLSDTSNVVIIKSLKILGALGLQSDIKAIQKVSQSDDPQVVLESYLSKFFILIRHNPEEAIEYFLSLPQGSNENEYISNIENVIPRISYKLLKALEKHPNKSISNIAIVELIKREQFNEGEVKALLESSDNDGIWLASQNFLISKNVDLDPSLIREGWKKVNTFKRGFFWHKSESDLEGVILKIYKTWPIDRLINKIGWLEENGHLAYYAYYLSHKDKLDEVRHDLRANFSHLKTKYIDDLTKKMAVIKLEMKKELEKKGRSITDTDLEGLLKSQFDYHQHIQNINKYDDGIIDRFTLSALLLLKDYGEKEDIVFARKHLLSRSNEIKSSCMEIIKKHGDVNDVSVILSIVFDSYGEIKEQACYTALDLDPKNQKNVRDRLLDSNDSMLIRIALRQDASQTKHYFVSKAVDLLLDKNSDIRMICLAYVFQVLKNLKDLESILESYIAKETYYYDVVCWSDRILYSPAAISKSYKKYFLSKNL